MDLIRPHRGLLLFFLLVISSCRDKTAKSDIEIKFSQDTLEIDYTYWWDESGPFIGYCGSPYSLVVAGTMAQLGAPNEDAGPLYVSQKGVVQLEKVFLINNPEKKSYSNEGYIATDCFYNTNFKVGDRVLVFCYEYEGEITISGPNSIVPIGDLEHPLVQSTKTFIDADENPLKIEKDTALWEAYGFGEPFKRIIRCRESVAN